MSEEETVTIVLHIDRQKDLFRAIRALDTLALHYQVASKTNGYKLTYYVDGDNGEPPAVPDERDA